MIPGLAAVFLALLFLPTRMIQEADPGWRLVSWLLATVVIGLTLCGVYVGGGGDGVRRYAFAVCFFIVSVPWPYPIEKSFIQGLTRASSAMAVEALGWLGVPAVVHGKVIEVSTGMVGLNEACSGIRSFQSSLMISLFLGELYRLAVVRRAVMCLAGFVLAIFFNVCRTSLLTWVAAKKGLAAISDYHDPAGVTILIACLLGLWAMSLALRNKKATDRGQKTVGGAAPDAISQELQVSGPWSVVPGPSVVRGPVSASSSDSSPPTSHSPLPLAPLPLAPLPLAPSPLPLSCSRLPLAPLALGLLAWLVVVEVGIRFWIRSHESHDPQGPRWSIAWPTDNPTFKRSEPGGQRLLRYDEAVQGEWEQPDGSKWQMLYLDWLPGRLGTSLIAKRHTPEICMRNSGWQVLSGPESTLVRVQNVHFPFRKYAFSQGSTLLHVFHCRWEPALERDVSLLDEHWLRRILRGMLSRDRGGQKILEIVVRGFENADAAQAAFVQQLDKLIRIEQLEAGAERGKGKEGRAKSQEGRAGSSEQVTVE